MYTRHWNLFEKPFELTPDPKYVYYSKAHEEALLRLMYTVRDAKGAMLLTGGYGCGKTVLSRVFLNELVSAGRFEVALITNPRYSAKELLVEIVYQLGGDRHDYKSKGELLHLFNEIIYRNLENEKETVIVIDEAQAIEDLETFEELRLLLNFQQNNHFLLTLILIGQPELRARLKGLPQLKQRLVIEYHLNALDERDCALYIDHRLRVAGAQREIFDTKAKKLIFKYSGGIPRVVNGIADTALLVGFSENKKNVDEPLLKRVVQNSELETAWSASSAS
ncbi:MAG: AAA family ATPase [Candidatus Omnitrophica bacterium]|nr:AAA family ATPase [Candidatus Omnitrophota bacterium]